MVGGEEDTRARGEPCRDEGLPGARRRRVWAAPAAWVSSTYFAEGFPYSVVNNLVEILFKELGASLQVSA